MNGFGENWAEHKKEQRPDGRERLGQTCFWAGLFLELLIVILDKSDYLNVYESGMFRIAFVLFALKVCLTRCSGKEWLWMMGLGLFSVIAYRVSGRDEFVRFAVFACSVKDIEVKKALRFAFWVTLAGSLMLILLSVCGIFGSVVQVADYGRGGGEVRYCLGMGHPNALSCMVFVLMTLGIYLYQEKLKPWHFLPLILLTAGTFFLTVSRSALLMMSGVLALAFVYTVYPKAKNWNWIYLLGLLAFGGGVAFSIVAAYYGKEKPMVPVLDRILTGRVYSSFDYTYGGGTMKNWSLFSAPENTIYFDMGYIRLFYWYGIVFACAWLLLYALRMLRCRREKDGFLFLLLAAFAVYTIFEAHFISVYLGRNYVLLLLAAGVHDWLKKKGGEPFYWWQAGSVLAGKENTGV